MKTCDDCPDQWDCEEPCLEVIAWQELEASDRMKDKYKPKGVGAMTDIKTKNRKLKLHKQRTANHPWAKHNGA